MPDLKQPVLADGLDDFRPARACVCARVCVCVCACACVLVLLWVLLLMLLLSLTLILAYCDTLPLSYSAFCKLMSAFFFYNNERSCFLKICERFVLFLMVFVRSFFHSLANIAYYIA